MPKILPSLIQLDRLMPLLHKASIAATEEGNRELASLLSQMISDIHKIQVHPEANTNRTVPISLPSKNAEREQEISKHLNWQVNRFKLNEGDAAKLEASLRDMYYKNPTMMYVNNYEPQPAQQLDTQVEGPPNDEELDYECQVLREQYPDLPFEEILKLAAKKLGVGKE